MKDSPTTNASEDSVPRCIAGGVLIAFFGVLVMPFEMIVINSLLEGHVPIGAVQCFGMAVVGVGIPAVIVTPKSVRHLYLSRCAVGVSVFAMPFILLLSSKSAALEKSGRNSTIIAVEPLFAIVTVQAAAAVCYALIARRRTSTRTKGPAFENRCEFSCALRQEAKSMKTELHPGETILKHGLVDLKRGLEAVSGKLFLTNQRLVHESGKLVIQRGITIILVSEVSGVRKSWVKMLNLIPIVPWAFTVTTRDGSEYEFIHLFRSAWIRAIENARRRK